MAYDNHSARRRTVLKTVGGGVIATALIAGTSGSVGAKKGTLYNLQFNKDSDVADWTADDPGWQVDRQAPEEWTRATGNPHNNVAKKNIDESGPTSGFNAFQGMKYLDAGGVSWGVEISKRVKAGGSIFIDPAWEENDEQRRTGLWYALGKSSADGDWTWFEILEYRSSAETGGDPAFFRFGSQNGYQDVGLPQNFDPERGGWVNTEMTASPGNNETAVQWKVNGKELVDATFGNPFGDTDHFMDFFVNSRNFGVDQDYYFDNFHAVIN